MSKRYALLNENNLVILFASQTEVDNSENGLVWVRVDPEDNVKQGYRYIPESGKFERVREPLHIEKEKLLKRINHVYESKMDILLSGYSTAEVQTFAIQIHELDLYRRAEQGAVSGDIIFMKALCQGRQIPEYAIWPRLREKINAFSYASGFLTGTRQRFEDYVNLVSDHEQLDEVADQVEKWSNS